MSKTATASPVDSYVAAVRLALAADQIQNDGMSAFVIDDVTPDVAVTPATPEELQTTITEASEAGLALCVRGGGAHTSFGNVPAAYDIAVATSALDRIVAYEPDDLTVTVEPGVRLHVLEETLRARGQTFPLDPPGAAEATVGGLIASNAFGPLRHAHGTVRDWLIGLRVVLADGTSVKSGGRVVKNVSGYDMHKLHVGSLGSLGVISEATFKILPAPRVETTLALAFDSSRAACAVVLAARDAGLAVRAAEVLSPAAAYALLGEHAWTALVRIGAGDAAVRRSVGDVTAIAASSGARAVDADTRVWEDWREMFAAAKLTVRASISPADVGEAIDVLDRQCAGAAPRLSATVAGGVVRLQLTPTADSRAGALVDRVRDTAARFGGGVVVEVAPLVYKQTHDVFGPLRPDFAIMQRLKQEFDPKRILAPGRFVGRL